jgi:methionyl-tRNA formyltransferase
MRVVFLGTGDFATAALDLLAGPEGRRIEIAGVVTAPDRPRGRGRKVIAGAVGERAGALGLELRREANVNRTEALDWIRERRPAAIAVVDFGQKLGRRLLDLPEHGCVNLHPSLLPRHRGASPVQYAILSGDRHTGVSILSMVDRMDAGPILARVATPVREGETGGELAERLRPLGARLLLRTLEGLADGAIVPEPQDDEAATLAPKITKDDRPVPWDRPAPQICRRILAFNPRPGAIAFLHGGEGRSRPVRLTLLRARPAEEGPGEPGRVLRVGKDEFVVAAGEGGVALTSLQPAGGREMDASEFVRGYRPRPGDRLAPTEDPS